MADVVGGIHTRTVLLLRFCARLCTRGRGRSIPSRQTQLGGRRIAVCRQRIDGWVWLSGYWKAKRCRAGCVTAWAVRVGTLRCTARRNWTACRLRRLGSEAAAAMGRRRGSGERLRASLLLEGSGCSEGAADSTASRVRPVRAGPGLGGIGGRRRHHHSPCHCFQM